MSICPICGEEVTPRSENKAFPFCNARCKSIDLGKWLSEDYRVPTADLDEDTIAAGAGEGDAGEAGPPKPDMRH